MPTTRHRRRRTREVEKDELAAAVAVDGDQRMRQDARTRREALAAEEPTIHEPQRLEGQVGVPHAKSRARHDGFPQARALIVVAISTDDLQRIDMPFEQTTERQVRASSVIEQPQQS